MDEYLQILTHDNHKLRLPGYLSHEEALTDELMKKSDGIAARLSRNWMECVVENTKPYRVSFLTFEPVIKKGETERNLRAQVISLLKEKDPIKLHELITKSQALSLYSESLSYPFSSLKFHLLLTCAIYYNLQNGFPWTKLYLSENAKKRSEYQVIYRDHCREWVLTPLGGEPRLSRVHLKFNVTWDRRLKQSIGGNHQVLSNLLSHIGSWSTALATIEEFMEE